MFGIIIIKTHKCQADFSHDRPFNLAEMDFETGLSASIFVRLVVTSHSRIFHLCDSSQCKGREKQRRPCGNPKLLSHLSMYGGQFQYIYDSNNVHYLQKIFPAFLSNVQARKHPKKIYTGITEVKIKFLLIP